MLEESRAADHASSRMFDRDDISEAVRTSLEELRR